MREVVQIVASMIAALALAGCDAEDAEDNFGGPCESDADCGSALFCHRWDYDGQVEQMCTAECMSDEECPATYCFPESGRGSCGQDGLCRKTYCL